MRSLTKAQSDYLTQHGYKYKSKAGGRHSTEVAFALHTQPPRVRFLAFPKFFQCSRGLPTGVLLRAVDSSGLLMPIEPIEY